MSWRSGADKPDVVRPRSLALARLGAVRLRLQAGFTMVEVVVATTLVIVGLLGTVALIDTANSSQAASKDREAGTNLARELLEDAHATPYSQISGSGWIAPKMVALQGGSGTVTTPTTTSVQTTVTRRGITYTANLSWCSLDDSKDGTGSHPSSIGGVPVTWCSDSATSPPGDSAPEDFKRVTATISYTAGGSKTIRETVTFSATGGMVAQSVSSLLPSSTPPGLSPNNPYLVSTSVTDVTFLGRATGAADMKFSVNGLEVNALTCSCVVNNNDGSWTFDWQIAGLTDGTYTISATAVDALLNRSAPMSIQVRLARGATLAPQNVQGGYNYVNPPGVGNGGSLVVELQWDANPEGSVTGYEVLRGGTSVCGGQTNLATTCLDSSPPSGGSTVYTIKTWYLDSNDVQQSVSTTYTTTAPGPLTQTNYFSTGTAISRTKCMATYVGSNYTQRDMGTTSPTGTDTTYSSTTNNGTSGCLPPFTAAATLSAGTATFSGWFTNTGTSACTLGVGLFKNAAVMTIGTGYNGDTAYLTIPASTTTATHFNYVFHTTANSFVAGDQLSFYIAGWKAFTACAKTTMFFNSAAHPTGVTMPLSASGGTSLTTPNVPTGLSVTVNADGTRTLNWTAPASTSSIPAPDFYRVYRDGTGTSARIDTADAINTTVSSATSAGATTVSVGQTTGYAAGQAVLVDTGANQDVMTISSVGTSSITFTAGMTKAHAAGVPVVLRAVSWTDTAAGGTSHAYRVTAVSPALAESAFAGPVSG